MEYVELWYFTTEGCREVSKATPTAADDTFSILNTDTGLALQSIKATKASRNAIADEHLTWEQIMTARHTLIETANRVGWPNKHTRALAEFYINLEGLKAIGDNPRALILYHAVVQRQWHETMRGRGVPFNLSIINENLFNKLENQIRDRDQEEIHKKASDARSSRVIKNQTNKNPSNLTPTLPPPYFTSSLRNATLHNATQHPPPPPWDDTRATPMNYP